MESIKRTFALMKGPYKELVKYFGVYNLDLSINEDSDWMDDQDFTFPLIIGKDRIAELLRKDMDLVLDGDDPVLDLTGKTVTFDEGATTNVVVKITASEGRRGRGGVRTLTSGGKFAQR